MRELEEEELLIKQEMNLSGRRRRSNKIINASNVGPGDINDPLRVRCLSSLDICPLPLLLLRELGKKQ